MARCFSVWLPFHSTNNKQKDPGARGTFRRPKKAPARARASRTRGRGATEEERSRRSPSWFQALAMDPRPLIKILRASGGREETRARRRELGEEGNEETSGARRMEGILGFGPGNKNVRVRSSACDRYNHRVRSSPLAKLVRQFGDVDPRCLNQPACLLKLGVVPVCINWLSGVWPLQQGRCTSKPTDSPLFINWGWLTWGQHWGMWLNDPG